MSSIQDLITKRKQAAKKLEPKRRTSKGVTIGKDYDDSPQVEDRPGFVWVREDKQGGGVFECFNPSVKLAVDIPVIIARGSGKSSRRVVQSVDWDALLVAITSSPPGIALSVPNHHRDHEFITMFPGLDVVNIYPRSIVPLKIYPGSTALTLSVAPGWYMVDKTSTYYVGLIDADISSYVPATVGNTVSLLVFIDSATNAVGYLTGTEGTLLYPVEPDIPDGDIGLGYIRLAHGDTGLVTESMITNDPRPFISIATGSGSGGVARSGSTTDGHLAIWNGTNTDSIKDGGVVPTGGGTPATTVTDETTWGISPAVGTSTNYARQDHTHGTPADPGGGVALDTVINVFPGPSISTIASDSFSSYACNTEGWKIGAITSVVISGVTWEAYIFYDDSGYINIATRRMPGSWNVYTTSIQWSGIGDDHNTISIGLDPNGYIHISYDQHDVALKYRKSTLPIDQFTGTLTSTLSMLGSNESSVTYPGFFNDPSGNLYFIFRDGTSLSGDTFIYKYDHTATTWAAISGSGSGGKVVNGKSDGRGVYHLQPYFDADFGSGGKLHIFWTYHLASGGTYDRYQYMAWDGSNFTAAGGAAQTIPARIGNGSDAITWTASTIQPSVMYETVYSDAEGYPHVVYDRDGGGGVQYLYHLWYDGSSWIEYQLAVPTITTLTINSIFVMDRDYNIGIAIYTDRGEDSLIHMLISAPNDYTTWAHSIIYNSPTWGVGVGGEAGYYGPKFDAGEWERNKRLVIPIEYWPGTGNHPAPIYCMDYTPSGLAILDALNYPTLHTNDVDVSSDAIHHTLGVLATQAAAGNHTHASSRVHEVVMEYGSAFGSPSPIINSTGDDWVYSS